MQKINRNLFPSDGYAIPLLIFRISEKSFISEKQNYEQHTQIIGAVFKLRVRKPIK
jgi:hypothetical protein